MTCNRFIELCDSCSVGIVAGGGHWLCLDNRWSIYCANCHAAETADANGEDIPPLPPGPPPGCAPTIKIRVYGLAVDCHKCHAPTTCAAVLDPDQPAVDYVGLITCESGEALSLARYLLKKEGHTEISASIKRRYSSNEGGRYLAPGCQNCDTILDLWPLSDEIFDAYSTRGLAGFSLLTTADCASRTWQRMLRSPVGWMG
jgi:hypothetical protein